MILLSADDLDFSTARPVISAAQKFVIPVAAFADAVPLLYPAGTEKAGQPITDWGGQPVGDKGIIFFNEIDRCYQAAPADGRSVIIINEVTAGQVQALREFIARLEEPIEHLCKRSLESLLAYAGREFGLVDLYNSTDDFVRAKMIPMDAAGGTTARPSGWMRRDDRDICHTVFVKGPARFHGPAATPQEIPPCGAFVVQQGASYRMVAAAVLLRTYMNLDASPLDLSEFL